MIRSLDLDPMWSSGPEATTRPTGSKDMRRRSTALRRPADTPIHPHLPTSRAAPDMAMVVRHHPIPLIPKTTSLLLRTDIQISNLPLTAARARASRTYRSRHCHPNSNSASGRDSLLTISELQVSLVRQVNVKLQYMPRKQSMGKKRRMHFY